MRARRIVFLDFDGVISSDRYLHRKEEGDGYLDPTRLVRLCRIIDVTGAEIVLSTSWRNHWNVDPALCDDDWRRLFAEDVAAYELPIVDRTPEIRAWDRAVEVRAWLEAHADEVLSYVILDDQGFHGWSEMSDRFVKTAGHRGGITEDEVDRAIELLMTPLPE